MVVNPKLACGLQECVGDLWAEGFLTDFTVIVENKEFQCHRFILSACCGFFKGLMASQLKEAVESCAHLKDINKETFEVILNSVYKGVDGLTQDNVIDLWHGADRLQIKYIQNNCEDFVIENITIENFAEYYHHAKVLGCTKVIAATQRFMLNTFDELRNLASFLDLPIEDIYLLVQSHDLNVSSEDNVVEFILRWTLHEPHTFKTSNNEDQSNGVSMNEEIQTGGGSRVEENSKTSSMVSCGASNLDSTQKKDEKQLICQEGILKQKAEGRRPHLGKLLAAARLYTVTSKCLEKLLNNPLTVSCKEALEIVSNAIFYQLDVERRQGQWPTAAIHRPSSNMEHVMVFINTDFKVEMYSLVNRTFQNGAGINISTDVQENTSIIVCDNVLYIEGAARATNSTSLFCSQRIVKFQCLTTKKQWVPDSLVQPYERNYSSTKSLFLADGRFILRCNRNGIQEYQVKQGYCWSNSYSTVRVDSDITHLAKFKNLILLFKEGDFIDETLVQCVDSETKREVSQSSISGPDDIVSFMDNNEVYILQTNGALRKIVSTQTDSVDFQYVGKLWDFQWKIYGAVSFRDQLFVFGEKNFKEPEGKNWKTSIPGIFPDIQIVRTNSLTRCLPMIVPKTWLR